jgi:hypothetical protein
MMSLEPAWLELLTGLALPVLLLLLVVLLLLLLLPHAPRSRLAAATATGVAQARGRRKPRLTVEVLSDTLPLFRLWDQLSVF